VLVPPKRSPSVPRVWSSFSFVTALALRSRSLSRSHGCRDPQISPPLNTNLNIHTQSEVPMPAACEREESAYNSTRHSQPSNATASIGPAHAPSKGVSPPRTPFPWVVAPLPWPSPPSPPCSCPLCPPSSSSVSRSSSAGASPSATGAAARCCTCPPPAPPETPPPPPAALVRPPASASPAAPASPRIASAYSNSAAKHATLLLSYCYNATAAGEQALCT
jgi:hypothetical protein